MMKKLICLALLAMASWGMGEEEVEKQTEVSGGFGDGGDDVELLDPLMQQAADFYFADMELVKANYRKRFAEVLRKADKVEVFLVDFDGNVSDVVNEGDPFGEGVEEDEVIEIDPAKHVLVAGSDATYTTILKSKVLNEEEQKKLLGVLAAAMSRKEQSSGAFCHFPIHGIRVHRGGKMVYETTFCWKCGNYGFFYPWRDSAWLGTTEDMEALFKKLMPIPQSEIDRFEKKYPSEKK